MGGLPSLLLRTGSWLARSATHQIGERKLAGGLPKRF